MAKFGAPTLVDRISGKIGGIVFSNSRSGPTIRVRVRPTNPRTTAQSAVRAALVSAARQYRDLSTDDAAAWRAFGLDFTLPDGMGGQFHPSGINAYVQLAAVYMAIHPGGTPPTTPPSTAYTGDTITVSGSGGADIVEFNPSAANTAGSTTELLVQRLASPNRVPSEGGYRIMQYHTFTGGGDSVDITVPKGFYSIAVRFVKTATGQRGPLVVLGTFQAS